MTTLIDSSSDSEVEFHINKKYAENYAQWREKEELQKLKDRYGKSDSPLQKSSSSSSSSSSESEDEGEIWTTDNEKAFLKTLSLLKSKDPKIYDESVSFFTVNKDPKIIANKSSKPLTLKDYERNLIVERKGELFEEEQEVRESFPAGYFEEQQKIKESFKTALHDSDDSDTDLLAERKKSKEETTAEEEDYLQWLKGEKNNTSGVEKELEYLHNYWNNPQLDSKESFLKDYILNKRYLEKKNTLNKIPTYEEIVDDGDGLSEDENTLEKQAVFEHKFNFRFEEPDPEFIKRYPRTVKDSLRRKDTHRKEKRSDYKERKRKEKELKREELKRLKALKRKEIMEKIEKLKEITGNDKIGFEEMDINEDFDPQKYDQRMNDLFGDDYYAFDEGDQKPYFPPDEEIDREVNWEHWEEEKSKYNEEEEPHCEDPDFNMDADYNPINDLKNEMLEASKKRKKRKSKLAEALLKKKPVFNPTLGSYEDYFDEYYKLDFEDIIGDMPCRFHYRKVLPNDFGLSAEEILLAKDKELNQWCSLKKTSQYRTKEEEQYDVQAFQKKSKNVELKQKILCTVYQKEQAENEEKGKNKKRRKKKKNDLHRNPIMIGNEPEAKPDSMQIKATTSEETYSLNTPESKMFKQPKNEHKLKNKNIHIKCEEKLNKNDGCDQLETNSNTEYKTLPKGQSRGKKFKAHTSHNETNVKHIRNKTKGKFIKNNDTNLEVSNERLKAYGINPKKFKNKLLYGKAR